MNYFLPIGAEVERTRLCMGYYQQNLCGSFLGLNGVGHRCSLFVATAKPSSSHNTELFGVDDSLVDGIPTGGGDAPVVGGVLIAVDSYLASFYFFVSIDTHDAIFFCI